MPFPLLLIPVVEGLLAAAAAAAVRTAVVTTVRVVAANAVPIAAAGTAVVVANEATKDSAPPAAGTTTIVGTGKMNCGDNGNYDDLLKNNGDGKLDRDHVPSKAALKAAALNIIDAAGIRLTFGQKEALFGKGTSPGAIANKGKAIAIPKKDHQQHSRTYAGRNQPDKIQKDAEDLQKAAEDDTKTIEDAEAKEMDDECFKKYQKAAEEIRKKTHAEYVKELTELIKDVMKKVK